MGWPFGSQAIFILPFLDKIIFHPSVGRVAEAGTRQENDSDGVRDGGK